MPPFVVASTPAPHGMHCIFLRHRSDGPRLACSRHRTCTGTADTNGPMGFPTINDKEIVMNWDTVTQNTCRHAGTGCRHTGRGRVDEPRALFIKSY